MLDNAETYRDQAFKILDPARTEVRFNSEWMDGLGVRRLIEVAAHVSVARLLERDDFEHRLEQQEPLFLHELLYPVIQGYDSVALEADLEIGGTDQKFNMLVGRELQRAFGQPSQVVMTMPLMEGLDGVRKMSKSLGNFVGLTERPEEMFGKLMSAPDRLMLRYYELLTAAPPAELAAIKSGAMHPMEAKKRLASLVVEEYHGAEAAARAREHFESKFQRREVPANTPVYRIAGGTLDLRADETARLRALDQRGAQADIAGRGASRRADDRRGELPLRARRAQGARSGKAPGGANRAVTARIARGRARDASLSLPLRRRPYRAASSSCDRALSGNLAWSRSPWSAF